MMMFLIGLLLFIGAHLFTGVARDERAKLVAKRDEFRLPFEIHGTPSRISGPRSKPHKIAPGSQARYCMKQAGPIVGCRMETP